MVSREKKKLKNIDQSEGSQAKKNPHTKRQPTGTPKAFTLNAEPEHLWLTLRKGTKGTTRNVEILSQG